MAILVWIAEKQSKSRHNCSEVRKSFFIPFIHSEIGELWPRVCSRAKSAALSLPEKRRNRDKWRNHIHIFVASMTSAKYFDLNGSPANSFSNSYWNTAVSSPTISHPIHLNTIFWWGMIYPSTDFQSEPKQILNYFMCHQKLPRNIEIATHHTNCICVKIFDNVIFDSFRIVFGRFWF